MLLYALPLRFMSAGIDTLGTPAITFALVIALLSLIYLVVQTRRVLAMDNGNQVMQEIAAAIQEGASAFLKREYTFLGRICRRRRHHHRRLPGVADRAQLCPRRDRLGRGRLPRHVHRRARQRAYRRRRQQEPE